MFRLGIVFVERHEHADAPHAVALLRTRHRQLSRSGWHGNGSILPVAGRRCWPRWVRRPDASPVASAIGASPTAAGHQVDGSLQTLRL